MVDIDKKELDELVDRKLVVRKKKDNLNLYKFHNKVFYKGLWNQSEQLLEARGLVLDDDGTIAQRPLQKLFNFMENGTKCHRDKVVVGYRKVNGFMAAVTKHNNELLVTTTGSFDSPYQQLAESFFDKDYFNENFTYVFEICHESDPHIIDEKPGVYFLGKRNKRDGEWFSPSFDETINRTQLATAPESVGPCSFDDLKHLNKVANHEGYVVVDNNDHNPILKLKSPLYLSKKAMMRVGKNAVDQMFDNPNDFKRRVDEEFYSLFEWIITNFKKEEWRGMTEQDRRGIIEKYFEWSEFNE